jgi:hypothetical protein
VRLVYMTVHRDRRSTHHASRRYTPCLDRTAWWRSVSRSLCRGVRPAKGPDHARTRRAAVLLPRGRQEVDRGLSRRPRPSDRVVKRNAGKIATAEHPESCPSCFDTPNGCLDPPVICRAACASGPTSRYSRPGQGAAKRHASDAYLVSAWVSRGNGNVIRAVRHGTRQVGGGP